MSLSKTIFTEKRNRIPFLSNELLSLQTMWLLTSSHCVIKLIFLLIFFVSFGGQALFESTYSVRRISTREYSVHNVQPGAYELGRPSYCTFR